MPDTKEIFSKFNSTFYSSDSDDNSLRQGDLIDLSLLKKKMPQFEKLYPYFSEKYNYCVVASQCCDISKSNSKFKVDCVQLLAVKPFQEILRDFSKKNTHLHSTDSGNEKIVIKESKKQNIQSSIRDFLNHNTKLHFYYPPPEPEINNTMLSVCLDITVSLKIGVYDQIKAARIKCLTPEYRHKLANKMGELFNRVGLDEFHIKCQLDQNELADFISNTFNYLEFK
jgi:hypothetical protein